MAETLSRASPFDGLDLAIPPLLVEAPPSCVRQIARGHADTLDAALGIALPRTPCRAARSALCDALWLGPDEWLLLSSRAFPGGGLVDISHRQAGLRLAGPRAAAAINAGCPLDLDIAAFPAGACTRTLLGKAGIVLWRAAPDMFHLEVARSFVPYVVALLREAARGLD